LIRLAWVSVDHPQGRIDVRGECPDEHLPRGDGAALAQVARALG